MKVQIERLHLRWSGRESGVDAAPAGRLWLSRLLAGADLHPPGMPPTALLVVTRLDDPLPGRIARSLHDARPTAEWEQAVRSRLTDLWQRAARPVAGLVAAGAQAVRFVDQAELTACVAVASVHVAYGAAPARHGAWWQGVVAEPPSRATLFGLLRREPRLLPAVVGSYLLPWGRAEAVLEALSPREALELARAVASEYAVPLDAVLRPAVQAPPSWPTAPGAPAEPEVRARFRSPPGASVATASQVAAGGADAAGSSPPLTAHPFAPALPPWAPLLARRGLSLPPLDEPARRLLLGLLLSLRVAPATVRAAGFLETLQAWWLGVTAGAATDDVTAVAPRAAVSGVADGGAVAPAAIPSAPGRSPVVAPERQAVLETATDTPTATDTAADLSWPEPIPTRLGGLLYLVNVLLRLRLLAEEANPWSLLEALGRKLVPPGYDDDPIWVVLADLAGRGPEEPLPELPEGMEEHVRHWLRSVLPGADEPERLLLLVDGHLFVTATHLDLVMDLDRIRLEVRLAGLDADPGWAPDFGRVIRFHFV